MPLTNSTARTVITLARTRLTSTHLKLWSVVLPTTPSSLAMATPSMDRSTAARAMTRSIFLPSLTKRIVTLTAASATDGFDGVTASVSGGFSNINNLIGSSTITVDQLTGPDFDTNWHANRARQTRSPLARTARPSLHSSIYLAALRLTPSPLVAQAMMSRYEAAREQIASYSITAQPSTVR